MNDGESQPPPDATDTSRPPEAVDAIEPAEAHDRQSMPVDGEDPPRLPYPVVGIGASAGGLEAVTDFLSTLRPDSGMAYVFVQHLPPTGDSMLVDILSKRTTLPVLHVEQGMAVEPNHFYVIRPGQTLTMKDGHFELGLRLSRPMHNRPVDDFFKSLANEQRERGIGIILAGMGSNGSAGAQAIKAVGGLCLAQEPDTTKYPSMPRHLIDAGCADYILPPQDMPEVLMAYAGHPYAQGQRENQAEVAQRDQQQVREILAILRTRTRQDFSGYKKPTVLRRIQRRMGLSRMTKLGDYARFLRQTPGEVTGLADDLLIHVTGFFRDREAWDALRQRVIVPLVASRAADEPIRCWVAACATGEEAYTLAMLLVEECDRVDKRLDIKIFATDMADRTLQNARAGYYAGGIESDIEPERLERFFTREDEIYRVRQELRERVVFAPQNVLQDPPFSRLDIATCRNLLIYLEPEMQHRILGLLHFGLRENGTLFLGTSETAGPESLFEPIDKKARIYRRVGPTRNGTIDFTLRQPGNVAGERTRSDVRAGVPRPSMAQLTTRALLEHHTPAAVTVDREHRIVYFHGRTDPFITTPRGEPTRDVNLLTRENVRGAVRTALHRAMSQNAPVTVLDGWVEVEPGRTARIAVTASPLEAKSGEYFVVSFQERGETPPDASAAKGHNPAGGSPDVAIAHEELHRVRDELQSTIEALQTSNEELKVSHEEVISTNEEMQSTNEELETSREEMQSLNEELSTVNAQLHAKMEEHQTAHSDLSSLLTSTDLAVLFLDTRLRIRRFTPRMRELMEVITTDIGRPLGDLAKKFTDPDLDADVEAVLARLAPIERYIQTLAGQWFRRRVTPYRTTDNRIDGVVMIFVDITASHATEVALRDSEELFRRAIQEAPIPVIMQAQDGQVLQVSRSWTELTGYELADVPTAEAWLQHAYGPGAGEIRRHMRALFNGDVRTLNVEFQIRSREGSHRHWSFSASSPGTLADGRRFIIGMAVDVTDNQHAQAELRESEERFRLLVDGAKDFAMLMLDSSGHIATWNEGAERLLGWTAAEAIGQPSAIIFTPEDRAQGAHELELLTAAQSGRAVDERWHVRKDHSRFWGSGIMTALQQRADGVPAGFVKVMRDQTHVREAAAMLTESKEAAEMANRIKDEFLATLSHELRTPLSAILLWGKILQRERHNPNPQHLHDGIDAIVSSAEAQKELVEDLLDVSRITSGNLRLHMQDVDLLPTIRSTLDAIAPAAAAKNITLAADIAADVGMVRCDPDRIRQVMWNLLTNAVKFTPVDGRVDITLARTSGAVQLRVSDNGVGIESEFLPFVFDRFRQADAGITRRHGGLGLGLAIVKQLIELHGGSIGVESPGVGKGSVFTVTLPLRRMTGKARHLPAVPPLLRAETDDAAALADVEVLLVEDDVETRNALSTLLRLAGLAVTEAASVASALDAYTRATPQLIVSDIGLGGEDGYALLGRIRELEAAAKRPPVPAIALTAFARDADRQRAMDAGFQHHIGKPVEPSQLLATIGQMMRSKR